jgi:hypothetical protein
METFNATDLLACHVRDTSYCQVACAVRADAEDQGDDASQASPDRVSKTNV